MAMASVAENATDSSSLFSSSLSGSDVEGLSYRRAFVCSAFYNSVGDVGFFVGILVDWLIIASYSRCKMQNPGHSQFGFQMLILEFIDAIPEAMFIGEAVSDGSIRLPIVLAILTLNIVNTMCTGFDLLARRGGGSGEGEGEEEDGGSSDEEDSAAVELMDSVLKDQAVKPLVIFGTTATPKLVRQARGRSRREQTQQLIAEARASAESYKKSPTRLFLFILINFSMGNILFSMMDEIYVEFEKRFVNTFEGWVRTGSLLLGTVLGVATVMLIIAGSANLGSCCSCCKRKDSSSSRYESLSSGATTGSGIRKDDEEEEDFEPVHGEPTFWNRLIMMSSSFLIVSMFAMFVSGLCGLFCQFLHSHNIVVVQPLFEGFSGGAFVGAVAGIMVPETTSQLNKSRYRGSWTQMVGMLMFISGVCAGMVVREYLFSQNIALWDYCDFSSIKTPN